MVCELHLILARLLPSRGVVWHKKVKGAAMKTSWMTMGIAALMMAGASFAQQAPAAKSEVAAPPTADAKPSAAKTGVVCPLSVGTAFNARLIVTLDARRNKAGDKFTAETTETVRYGRSVILPRGTIIEGHVVRRSISTHGPDRAALFLQFDRAILKNGQETVMNAGIQALALGPDASAAIETASAGDDPDAEAPVRNDPAMARDALPLDANLNADGSAKNKVAVSREPESPRAPVSEAPTVDLPLTQGAFTKHGLLTSDSKGALGAPDIRIYTPLSEGSDGTVMMSTKKNVHLERGTRILIVIQPPRVADAAANAAAN